VAELPEHLLRRAAEARAKAEGRDVEEVLAEMKGETAVPRSDPAPGEPEPQPEVASAGLETSSVPEHLLLRAAESRAMAEGRDIGEVLAELRAEAGTPAPAVPEPAAAPTAPAPEAPAEPPAPAPAAEAPAPAASGRDLAAESEQYGVPVPLLERAMQARQRHGGAPAPAAEPAPAAAPPAAPAQPPAPVPPAAAPPPAAPPAAATPVAPAATATLPPPGEIRTQRLLTVVKAGAIQQVKKEPTDKVNTWPHLLAIEFVALMVVLAGLIIFSVFVNAPLLEFANFNQQPNPSKAPWYFLGLQELLSYFDPQVAGVIIPSFGLIGIALIPYLDKNPSSRPADRKLAIMLFTFFIMAAAVLTIYGSFFRGPGFSFTFPWVDGVFFDF
jgi:menaquinol-cytochrome c reductase cytochrome b/c subunit